MLGLRLGLGLGLGANRGGSVAANDPVAFDGVSDYLLRGAGLTGAADSATVSGYLKIRGPSGGLRTVVTAPGGVGVVQYVASDKFSIIVRTAAPAIIFSTTTTINVATGLPVEIHWSFNGSTGVGEVYVDGVSAKGSGTETTGTVDNTVSNWAIAANTAAGSKWDGDIYRVAYWQDVALDVTDASVRANMTNKFLGAILGDNIIDLSGDGLRDGTNSGSGGDFTVNGSPS